MVVFLVRLGGRRHGYGTKNSNLDWGNGEKFVVRYLRIRPDPRLAQVNPCYTHYPGAAGLLGRLRSSL